MLCLVLLAVVIVPLAHAQETEIDLPNNKTQCIKQMVEWCNGMQGSQTDAGVIMISIAFGDQNGYYRVFCVSGSDGTNCTRNGSPWFACTPDHIFTYKGQVLSEKSTDVDDEICKTADKAFNELFIQNTYHNTNISTEFQKSLQEFFEEMAAMQAQIAELQKRLGFGGGYWNGFDDSFLFPEIDSTEQRETSTKDSNQIEKE